MKSINENTTLLIKAIVKNIAETVLINEVVLGNLKLTPMVIVKVIIKKIKLPKVSKFLFALVLKAKKP